MAVETSDIEKVSGWVWGLVVALVTAISWLVRKVFTASKFILEVEEHKVRIKAIEASVKAVDEKVDDYRKESGDKLDAISRMIQADSDCRARVAEQRIGMEIERNKDEAQRHIDLLEAVNALRLLTKSNEERRKNTHALLETVKIDLRTTNSKFDQYVNKHDKVVSFVDGKFGLELSKL